MEQRRLARAIRTGVNRHRTLRALEEAGARKPPPSSSPDAALNVLDDVARTPLGQAWFGTDPKIQAFGSRPATGVVAPLPRRKTLAHGDPAKHGMPPMAKSQAFEAGV